MSKTKVPALPAPTGQNLLEVAKAIKGVLEVREGLIGDPLDANVTFRDLSESGVIQTTVVRRGTAPGTVVVSPVAGGGTTGYDPTEDFTPPPAPTGFAAAAALTSVILSWDAPSYPNHSFTEIWRHDADVIGDAVLVGTTQTQLYADYLGPGETRYYWVRFRSQADVVGAYNATAGTLATTGQDVSKLLDSISQAALDPDTSKFSKLVVRSNLFAIAPEIDFNQEAQPTATAAGQLWYQPSTGATKTWNATSSTWDAFSTSAPFVVNTEPVTVNGVNVPPGVYMDAAFIKNGTITDAKIGDLRADKITAGYTSSVDLEAGVFFGSDFYIGGTATYEYNDPVDGTRKTGIASVANPAIALKGGATPTAEFTVDAFKVKTSASAAAIPLLTVSGTTVRINFNELSNTLGDLGFTGDSNANYVTNTNQLTDGANLGGTAAWTGVSGRPASLNDLDATAATALANKLNSDARNALSGSAGLAIGSINWNSSGVRTEGYGVGITSAGIAAYNAAGNATFSLNASDGSATYAGELSASQITAGTLSIDYLASITNNATSSSSFQLATYSPEEDYVVRTYQKDFEATEITGLLSGSTVAIIASMTSRMGAFNLSATYMWLGFDVYYTWGVDDTWDNGFYYLDLYYTGYMPYLPHYVDPFGQPRVWFHTYTTHGRVITPSGKNKLRVFFRRTHLFKNSSGTTVTPNGLVNGSLGVAADYVSKSNISIYEFRV